MATPTAATPSPPCSSVVFLITGASRGLGKAIATVAARYYASEDHRSDAKFVLVARSVEGLDDTKQEILSALSGNEEDIVVCRAMDLSDLDRLDANADLLMEDIDRLCAPKDEQGYGEENEQQQRRVVFVNNAGSLGHLGPCLTSPSLEDMRQSIDFNVTSALWLSVRFARHTSQQQQQPQQQRKQRRNATIVHVSSLVAISDDFVSMGIYSAGKSARERYHTMMAREEGDDDDDRSLAILNYAPGPLETAMTSQIRGADELDAELKKQFQKTLEDPGDSALKLIRLLEEKNYFEWESGAHVDFYDLPANETQV
mmetsp:Transcript_19120/g.53239  ORF Transcript_19120/g.53239 Transcript_19120/m.53239 type:complete len:314 (-) Transcript_19120:467-1408(-)